MRIIPISDKLLSETNLLAWYKLRKDFDKHPSIFEYILLCITLFTIGIYVTIVVCIPSWLTLLDIKEACSTMLDILSSTASSALAVLLPSFAIFMALGQTKSVSYLATIENENTGNNYLKMVMFPFVYASTISLCAFVISLFLKSIFKLFFQPISLLHYWPTAFCLCTIFISTLGTYLLCCVFKDFIFNMSHIVIFIIINAPQEPKCSDKPDAKS